MARGVPPKGLLIDNLGHCSLVVILVAYLVFFLSAVAVGVTGPKTFAAAANPAANIAGPCVGGSPPAACAATWHGTLTDMSPYHQYMWLTMTQARPRKADGDAPALAALDVRFDAVYQVDVTGVTAAGQLVLLALNQTHVVPMHWAPNAATSDPAWLFMTQEIRYVTYRLTVRFANALGVFTQGDTVQNHVAMNFVMNFVNKEYTNFEMGCGKARAGEARGDARRACAHPPPPPPRAPAGRCFS
jgi:hypothetical protein